MTRAGAFNVKNPSLAERAGVSLRQKQTKPRICQDARVFVSRASKEMLGTLKTFLFSSKKIIRAQFILIQILSLD